MIRRAGGGSSGWSAVQLCQGRRGVLLGVYLAVGALDATIGADEVADARRRPMLGVGGRAIGEPDLLVGVAQEGEIEAELFRELTIRLDVVEADAEDLHVLFRVVGLEVAERAALGRAAGRVRHRVEPQKHALTAQL